jgi:Tol biopolymer transport system component
VMVAGGQQSGARGRNRRRPAAALVAFAVGAVVIGAAILFTLLWDDSHKPGQPPRLGDDILIVGLIKGIDPEEQIRSLVTVNTDTRRFTQLRDAGARPTISPDRRHYIYMVGPVGAAVPWISNSDGTDNHEFVQQDDQSCNAQHGHPNYSNRPAWSPSGTLVALICTFGGDSRPGIYVYNAKDGSLMKILDTRGVPDGDVTWTSDDSVVFEKIEVDNQKTAINEEELRALWIIRSVRNPTAPIQLTDPQSPATDTDPDWSMQNGLVFVRRDTPEQPEGLIMTCRIVGTSCDPHRWSDTPHHLAIWSPDGQQLAYTDDGPDGKPHHLSIAPFDNPSKEKSLNDVDPSLQLAAPAWGSR